MNSDTGDSFPQQTAFWGSFSCLPVLGRADSEGEQLSLHICGFFQLHHRVAVDELG